MPNNGNNLTIPNNIMNNNLPIDPVAGMSVYKPQGSGTLLTDLIKDNESIASNKSNHSTEYKLSDSGRSNCDKKKNKSKKSYYKKIKKMHKDNDSDYNSIRELATDVNNSLQALENIEYIKKKKKLQDTETDIEDSVKDTTDTVMVEMIEYEYDYLKILTEFILLLTLYVIMSQTFVLGFASGYIYQLNPTDDGVISLSGIIIYGILLTVIFMITRKIIFSNM